MAVKPRERAVMSHDELAPLGELLVPTTRACSPHMDEPSRADCGIRIYCDRMRVHPDKNSS